MDLYADIVSDLLTKANRFCVEDFATASGLTTTKARLQLMRLEMEGLINQIGRRFYRAEKTISPAQFWGVARVLTKINGGCFTSKQFAEAIGIDARSAATQLRRMIAEGQIERIGKTKYAYIPKTDK